MQKVGRQVNRWICVVVVVAGVSLAGCSKPAKGPEELSAKLDDTAALCAAGEAYGDGKAFQADMIAAIVRSGRDVLVESKRVDDQLKAQCPAVAASYS